MRITETKATKQLFQKPTPWRFSIGCLPRDQGGNTIVMVPAPKRTMTELLTMRAWVAHRLDLTPDEIAIRPWVGWPEGGDDLILP